MNEPGQPPSQFPPPLERRSFEPGEGSPNRALLHVYPHGAHVTQYQRGSEEPLLFLSRLSHFAPDKAIRGGVPVIFPWFGPHSTDKTAPQHGFARTAQWRLERVSMPTAGAVQVTFRLLSSEATRRWLPNDFELLYTIDAGDRLDLALTVRNLSDSAFQFEEALHTYLRVADVRRVSIEGLAGRSFIDKVDGARRKVQSNRPITISGETDRVYLDTPDAVTVTDPDMRRRLLISKTNSASTVVWNPWVEKAKAMSDFGDDEWPRMLCIETANVADNRVTLAPGAGHTTRATIASEPL